MLGELIGESRGKRTGRRVVSTAGGSFRVEVNVETEGKLLGMDAHEVMTYWAEPRPDGSLYGEGQAAVLLADGAAAVWRGSGVGKFGAGGAVSYRGAVFYNSPHPKLARLNTVAAVFEFEVDADGNTHSKAWEWK